MSTDTSTSATTGSASPVQHLGMVGLGRMGGGMRDRLREAGLQVTGYDRDPDATDVDSLAALVEALPTPRAVWVMVPAGDVTHSVITELAGLLEEGDLVVDGGNSKWTADEEHAQQLAARGVRFVDCGVSGGVWGLEAGYGLMCGGAEDDVARMMPVFDALRPEGPREEGFVHAGLVGAGHYAKMVHNGIEYGLMQAYAEGFELLLAKGIVTDETGCFKAWTRGTVVRSWLLDLLVRALEEDPALEKLQGYVDDSGEGRWTVQEAVENAVPAPVMSAALFARFTSRQADSPAMKAVAALRNQFGGHAVHTAGPSSGGGDTPESELPETGDETDAAKAGPTSGGSDVDHSA
ncbi:phosphogluconate dehydrogenase (NAD(+)-dependent, decarboxylating) [uncultured Pseudokineococcus sp.]|uniref:phosphogluconate dehydrogenase (NAD(+)-dependent, decarboxylating) n=1 Tax=uncultured Pseudokineococcus sp. TaxID=1642928 RepID=UPI00261EA067|nr:decarboxylating 6-phosphogluconate dehydrogenase [uncultured Pseudokineococcus sp.]